MFLNREDKQAFFTIFLTIISFCVAGWCVSSLFDVTGIHRILQVFLEWCFGLFTFLYLGVMVATYGYSKYAGTWG